MVVIVRDVPEGISSWWVCSLSAYLCPVENICGIKFKEDETMLYSDVSLCIVVIC